MPNPRAPVRIAGTGSAFPPHACTQADAVACLRVAWADHPDMLRRVEGIAANSGVRRRHLSLPVLDYATSRTFGERNDTWIRVATELGESAAREAIARAGLQPADIETIVFTTVTGLATPSIDARLVHRLGLRHDVRRVPLFGLGCVAGAAGVARAADLARGGGGATLLLSVELCSLTLRLDDVSLSNLVAICLFGDGATAAVLTDDAGAGGPAVVDSRATLYPDTERVMGWDVSERGFQLVLSPEVPDVVRRFAGRDVDAFLGAHGMTRGDVARWIVHPGGPKVLEAMQDSLEIGPAHTELTWRSLRRLGNLSSSSILAILGDTLEAPPPDGSHGLMIAMGPGFCSELVLLRWGA